MFFAEDHQTPGFFCGNVSRPALHFFEWVVHEDLGISMTSTVVFCSGAKVRTWYPRVSLVSGRTPSLHGRKVDLESGWYRGTIEVSLSSFLITIWESTSQSNKPWFMNQGLTLATIVNNNSNNLSVYFVPS